MESCPPKETNMTSFRNSQASTAMDRSTQTSAINRHITQMMVSRDILVHVSHTYAPQETMTHESMTNHLSLFFLFRSKHITLVSYKYIYALHDGATVGSIMPFFNKRISQSQQQLSSCACQGRACSRGHLHFQTGQGFPLCPVPALNARCYWVSFLQ